MNEYSKKYLEKNEKIVNSPEYRNCMEHYQEMVTAFFLQKGVLFRYHAYGLLRALKELPSEEPCDEIKTEFMLSYEKFKQMSKEYKKASPEERDRLFLPEKMLHKPIA